MVGLTVWSHVLILCATFTATLIAYAWFASTNPTELRLYHTQGRLSLPLQCRTRWVLSVLDALYLFLAGKSCDNSCPHHTLHWCFKLSPNVAECSSAGLMTKLWGQYPSKRFFNKGSLHTLTVITHIVCGSFIVGYGECVSYAMYERMHAASMTLCSTTSPTRGSGHG